MSFVDNLMDMLKNGKEEDGAATARNNLSQTWDYPSLVAALPYRYYDDRNEILHDRQRKQVFHLFVNVDGGIYHAARYVFYPYMLCVGEGEGWCVFHFPQ